MILPYFRQLSAPVKLTFWMTLLDQVTKYIAMQLFAINVNVPITSRFVIFPTINDSGNGWLDSIYQFNSHSVLIVYLLVFGLIVFFWVRSIQLGCTNKQFYHGLALILAGLLGNSIDRMHMDGVLDWALIKVSENCWPGFNVADVATLLGIITLLISVMQQISNDVKTNNFKKNQLGI